MSEKIDFNACAGPLVSEPAERSRLDASGAFVAPYETCTSSRFNRLVRNRLNAEHLVRSGDLAFRRTVLFCHQDDGRAIGTGQAFSGLLKDGGESFHIITFASFIAAVQRLSMSREQREWSMRPWARRCGRSLGERTWRACGHAREAGPSEDD